MTDAHPPAPRPPRVLLVEPHPLVREQLRAVVDPAPGLVVVGECTSAGAALELVDDLALRRAAARAGAAGVVVTQHASRTLVATIREVTAGPVGGDPSGRPS